MITIIIFILFLLLFELICLFYYIKFIYIKLVLRY